MEVTAIDIYHEEYIGNCLPHNCLEVNSDGLNSQRWKHVYNEFEDLLVVFLVPTWHDSKQEWNLLCTVTRLYEAVNTQKLGEGMLHYLESCIDEPILGTGLKLQHLVSGKEKMVLVPNKYILAKEAFWYEVFRQIKVQSNWILGVKALSVPICSFGKVGWCWKSWCWFQGNVFIRYPVCDFSCRCDNVTEYCWFHFWLDTKCVGYPWFCLVYVVKMSSDINVALLTYRCWAVDIFVLNRTLPIGYVIWWSLPWEFLGVRKPKTPANMSPPHLVATGMMWYSTWHGSAVAAEVRGRLHQWNLHLIYLVLEKMLDKHLEKNMMNKMKAWKCWKNQPWKNVLWEALG